MDKPCPSVVYREDDPRTKEPAVGGPTEVSRTETGVWYRPAFAEIGKA